jgi:hypothetical protein
MSATPHRQCIGGGRLPLGAARIDSHVRIYGYGSSQSVAAKGAMGLALRVMSGMAIKQWPLSVRE